MICLKQNRRNLIYTVLFLTLIACNGNREPLPYLGESEVIDGKTSYYTVPQFEFLNQDSQTVSNQSLSGKAYIADFFFTSCPTICPKVKTQMIRLREMLGRDKPVVFLSMSIDYRKDSIPTLKKYAEKLGISSSDWHLVQLKKEQLNKVANQFFNIALEDETAPGGFDHSGRLILVDANGHIRSYCDGTDPDSVDRFAKDVQKLLDEMG